MTASETSSIAIKQLGDLKKITIIGLGLISASWCYNIKKTLDVSICAYGRSKDRMLPGLELGLVDCITTDLQEAVYDADVIVVATPVQIMQSIFSQMTPFLKKGVIITDVGSVKGSVIKDAQVSLGSFLSNFVPGHPIAGSEKSGVTAFVKNLYLNKNVILTPIASTNKNAVEIIRQLWHVAGATVHILDPILHDRALAGSSHLPHLLSFILVHTLSNDQHRDLMFEFAAGGFRDFTRIAESDPTMWHDIFMTNKHALKELLQLFKSHCNLLENAIDTNDSSKVMNFLTLAKQEREYVAEKKGFNRKL